MKRNITDLTGKALCAADGDIGEVSDFYFDDKTWVIRYLVAETGTWLDRRRILLSPHAFGNLDGTGDRLSLNITREQIGKSPPYDAHLPLSRLYEEQYFGYYGWPAYWNGGGLWGVSTLPLGPSPVVPTVTHHHGPQHQEDLHLRSIHEVTGYHIQATDGQIGKVSDFVMDDADWMIAETGHWYSGKKIFIAPSMIGKISYGESKVYVDLTQADIRETAENQLAEATAGAR